MRMKRGFTLVELLVVIGIIAVLIAVLLPTLANARSAAQRTACLSNMRQLSQAIVMYANANRGSYPPSAPSLQSTLNDQVWRSDGPSRGPTVFEGWIMLGNLFVRGYIKSPKAFYCPSQTDRGHQYPDAWNNSSNKTIGYMYRIVGQKADPVITQAAVNDFNKWKLNYPKGIKALAADVMGVRGTWTRWPHARPYGVNVAFSDGHGAFVQRSKYEYDRCAYYFFTGSSPDPASAYMYLFFNGVDSGDYTELHKRFP